MADWLKEHPIGAYLLNILTTILIVGTIVAVGVKRYGKKIDEMHIDTKIIMNEVISLPDTAKVFNNGR